MAAARALLALLLPALWAAAGGLQVSSTAGSAYGTETVYSLYYDGNPVSEEYSQLVEHKVPTDGMVPIQEHGLAGKSDVVVMGYPQTEDFEVSGTLANSGGQWEGAHLTALCQQWRDQAVGNFLDVGANIGTYTLPMSGCVAGKGSVIAVEGVPSIADHLRAGITANGASNVVLYNYAVGDMSRRNSVEMLLNSSNKGASSVAGNKPNASAEAPQADKPWRFHRAPGPANLTAAKPAALSRLTEVSVPLTNLDSILRKDPRMKALLSAKVDIEGSEGRMIQGAEELFSKYPPCLLVMELIPDWLGAANTPVAGVIHKLQRFGYDHVPTRHYLRHARIGARTVHMFQKDMAACKRRVAAQHQANLAASGR